MLTRGLLMGTFMALTLSAGAAAFGDDLIDQLARSRLKQLQQNPVAQPTQLEALLISSAILGDTDTVDRLIQLGVDVNCRGIDGGTPLGFATFARRYDVVRLLLEHGADPNKRSADGQPPLFQAVLTGDPMLVSFLIAHGADVNLDDGEGATALAYAAQNESPALTEILLTNGANPNTATRHHGNRAYVGYTPLHWAVSGDHLDNVKLLLARGANAKAADEDGQTPLHFARRADIAGLLIKAGANVNRADKYQWRPLHVAVSRDEPEMVRLLLQSGADRRARALVKIDQVSPGGRTYAVGDPAGKAMTAEELAAVLGHGGSLALFQGNAH
jgi:ankyrin repeat protein